MEDEAIGVTLSFAFDLDERAEWEIQQKGYFEHAVVFLPDGSALPVSFWDPVRLAQDLEIDVRSGGTCIAELGMIIIPEVTVENMKAAVKELHQRGFFARWRLTEPRTTRS
jgi:hypothetical protein